MLGRVTERERETNGKGERVVRQGENTLGAFVLSSPCSACEVCGESLDDDALSIDDPLLSRCRSSVCHKIPAITDYGFLTTCYRRYNFTKTKREKKQGFEKSLL